jgi:nucleolar protein 56
MLKLKAFSPFSSKEQALANINCVSEHSMHSDLKDFLEANLPKMKKDSSSSGKGSFKLGVIEPDLAKAISEGFSKSGQQCPTSSDDTIREIIRAIRLNVQSFVPQLGNGPEGGHSFLETSQLGLGHSYSRAKVKFNPARTDNMVIQSIALLDQLDKDLNTFAMRTREWYSWHFPELKEVVKDNYMYARAAALIGDKASLISEGSVKVEKLIEIVGDKDLADQVIAAAKTSMGMECSPIDMLNINSFTQRMVKLAEYRKQLSLYLSSKMQDVAPNLSALIGDTVAARLISKAGSLTSLAKAPASTVQILGAEKALFRALKTKGNTPKYGLIYHSTFIGRADTKNKGRISRYLANKCSIASRIDSFGDMELDGVGGMIGKRSNLYGEKLKNQVEERLRFYETGEKAQKNVDAMAEVALALGRNKPSDAMEVDSTKKSAKKEKKEKSEKKESKKRSRDEEEEVVVDTPKSEKKEKKEKSEKKAKKAKA